MKQEIDLDHDYSYILYEAVRMNLFDLMFIFEQRPNLNEGAKATWLSGKRMPSGRKNGRCKDMEHQGVSGAGLGRVSSRNQDQSTELICTSQGKNSYTAKCTNKYANEIQNIYIIKEIPL